MIENTPDIWLSDLLAHKPDTQSHKYTRGQAVIVASGDMVGATALAATACARIGAGIVRVLVADYDTKLHLQTVLPPHIIVTDDFDVIYDERTKVILAGPGVNGQDVLLDQFLDNIPHGKQVILDGGALSYIAHEGRHEVLNGAVITPHEGEYDRLFSGAETQAYLSTQYNCHIIRKGAETHITAPNGKECVNKHSAPWLATAGTGDVLAGMITGLCAQGLDPFQASCASVWMHGEAGIRLGAGMVASDIESVIPHILKDFYQ